MFFNFIKEYSIKTSRTKEQILNIIHNNIEPSYPSLLYVFKSGTKKPFSGNISEDSFKITPIIFYNLGARPVIKGKIMTQNNNTTVTIKYRPNLIHLIFLLLITVISITTFILIIYDIIYYRSRVINLLLLIGFLGITFAIQFIPYRHEINKAKNLLYNLLVD